MDKKQTGVQLNDWQDEKLSPAILVIFGITGDLSHRKLLPALYELVKNDLLHPDTEIVGVSRREVSVDTLLKNTELSILENDRECDQNVLAQIHDRLSMMQMDMSSDSDYDDLHEYLNEIEASHGLCMNRLFYLSVPPQALSTIIEKLGQRGLNTGCQHGVAASRLLAEKPFGYDLRSGEELIENTKKYFVEEQIFRIDHYVAKETVQNILTFRFRNPIFENVWDKSSVHSIDIAATEQIGIEGRATFYEQTGALRDLVQSHLLQLLATTTMEKPSQMTSDSIHASKLQVLNSIEPALPKNAVRGQYESYKKEVENDKSNIETFAAVKLKINSPRWQGVPVTLRTGKALNEKKTDITVAFKPVAKDHDHINILTFNIQPNEGINIGLWVKRPGFERKLQTASMAFRYDQAFDEHGHPDAYERVLVDAIRGDHTLFATSEEVIASWKVLEPLIKTWQVDDKGMHIYASGSEGPSLQSLTANH